METNFFDDPYLPIFEEIKYKLKRLNKEPDYVVLPIGSGELFRAALRYYHLSDTKVLGVTTDFRGTAATMLYAKYRPIMRDVEQKGNPESYEIIKATETQIRRAYGWTRSSKIDAEPSAAAAFVALRRHKFRPNDIVVVINTGDGRRNFFKPPY